MSIAVMNTVWENGPDDRTEFMVLLALADWSDDKGNSWPGIEALAKKSRCSVRTAQITLNRLKDHGKTGIGLIKIFPGAGPSGVNKYQINLALLKAGPVGGISDARGGAESAPPAAAAPPAESAGGCRIESVDCTRGVQMTDSSLHPIHQEPSGTITHSAQERAGEDQLSDGDDRADRKAVKRTFQRLVAGWPNFAGLSLASAERAFHKLSPEDREAALRMRGPWLALLRRNGKDHTPAPSTYLSERLWEAVPQQQPSEAEHAVAPPFGKAWTCHLLRLLATAPVEPPAPSAFIQKLIDGGGVAGRREELQRLANYGWPRANAMLQRAAEGKGMSISPQEAQDLPEMHAVAVDAPTFHQWRLAFDERGWPWLKLPRGVAYVWFPVDGPPTMQTAGPSEPRAQSG
ncbi:helix-turn-helix domain-containing protein [Rhizobium leguminosarum]